MEQAQAAEQRERFSQLIALYELLHGKSPPPRLTLSGRDWDDFGQWWPMRVLRQAAEERDIEGCKRLLYVFLMELDIRLPERVLLPFRWKAGRRDETEAIYKAWVDKGSPILSGRVCGELAKQFYPEESSKAKSNPNLRKKLRDRIRATIRRHSIRETLAPVKGD
jgi:hypothetical protein